MNIYKNKKKLYKTIELCIKIKKEKNKIAKGVINSNSTDAEYLKMGVNKRLLKREIMKRYVV